MSRHSMTAAALLGLALACSPVWADSQDQRRSDSQDQQTHHQLRAFLGVGVTTTAQEGNQDQEGITVLHVNPNSPAGRAGLRQGDVITQIGRRTVEDFRDLSNAINRLQPGDQVSIKVQRNGQQRKLRVTLASAQGGFMQDAEEEDIDQQARGQQERDQQGRQMRSQDDSFSRGQGTMQRLMQRFRQLENRFEEIEQQARGQGEQRQYGRMQEESTSQSPQAQQRLQRLQQRVEQLEERLQQVQGQGQYRQGTQLGIQAERRFQQGGQGLRVTDLEEESPAAEAGLRRGDVILRVEGRTVSSTQDLRQAMRQAEPGQEVTLEVLRNGRHVDIDVRTPRASRSQARGYQRLQQRVEQLESRIRELEQD